MKQKFMHKYSTNQWASWAAIVNLCALIFVFHPELLPPVFIRNNYFVFNDQVHHYNFWTKKDLYNHSCNTTFGKRDVSDVRFRAACLWNNLPLSLKKITSEKLFNNKLNYYCLSGCKDCIVLGFCTVHCLIFISSGTYSELSCLYI